MNLRPLRASGQSPRRARPPRAGSLLANLAAAPFVNRRPVQRFTLAAWVVGALLAALNVFLWLQYRNDSTALRARLSETRSAIEAKSGKVVEIGHQLGGLGLASQNVQVDFLNRRIAERTFPWSLLFERIAAVLPNGVRLISLNPVFQDLERRAAKAAPTPPEDELVELKIQGVAKSDEDLYDLIDAFFAAPAFESPRLYRETRSAAEVRFTVDVRYRPRFTSPSPAALMGPPAPTPSPMGQPESSQQPATAAPETVAEAGVEVDG